MSRPRVKIRINPDGTVVAVNSEAARPFLEAIGEVRLKRASHVEPVNRPLRLFFHILRLLGENGRVAAWTRKWGCLWRVDLGLSHGPVLGPFKSRQQAIQSEVEWLNNNVIAIKGDFNGQVRP